MNERRAWLLVLAIAVACAPASAPETVPSAVRPATARRSPVLLQVTAVGQSAEVRSALFAASPVAPRTVAMRGVDLLMVPRNGGLGISARLMQSSLGAGDLGSREAGVVIGGLAFGLEAAYAQRNGYSVESGLLHDSLHTFLRGGLRMRGVLGNTGGALAARAGYYMPMGEEVDGERVEGWEGETTLTWSWARYPVQAMLGYRLERFYVGGLEQEVSALLVGAGFAIGVRR